VNAGEEVASELVVAGGDGAELLQLAKEVFDQVPHLVEVSVEVPRHRAVALGRDHRGFPGGGEPVDDPAIDVIRLVGNQRAGSKVGEEGISPSQVMRLSGGEQEGDGVAERIDQGMDLGAQPAFAAADRLVFAVFLGAPALC
jgi:hypothetical protein